MRVGLLARLIAVVAITFALLLPCLSATGDEANWSIALRASNAAWGNGAAALTIGTATGASDGREANDQFMTNLNNPWAFVGSYRPDFGGSVPYIFVKELRAPIVSPEQKVWDLRLWAFGGFSPASLRLSWWAGAAGPPDAIGGTDYAYTIEVYDDPSGQHHGAVFTYSSMSGGSQGTPIDRLDWTSGFPKPLSMTAIPTEAIKIRVTAAPVGSPPPSVPSVTDDGAYATSTNQLHAHWHSDCASGIAEYSYAIGLSQADPGSGYTLGWTSAGTSEDATPTGLGLQPGTVYYVYAKAKSAAGVWSQVGISDGIAVGSPVSLADAKSAPTGQSAIVSGACVTAKFSGYAYIEDPGRVCGLRVKGDLVGVSVGDTIDVAGQMICENREKAMQLTTFHRTGTDTVRPVCLPSRGVGGGDWSFDAGTGAGQEGVSSGSGPNNVGLLIKLCGVITQVGTGYVYIDDGSNLADGTGPTGIRVVCDSAGYSFGACVEATGISSVFGTPSGGLAGCVLARDAGSVRLVGE